MGLLQRIRVARAAMRMDSSRADDSATPTRPARSVAIVMDGNGRWAQDRGLPVAAGHRAGAQALKEVVRHAPDVGVTQLTVFSFSTENWSRSDQEVGDLMDLFIELIDREVPELNAEGVRLRFVGRLHELPKRLQERIAAGEAATAANSRLTLFVAMNYGGRAEILDAARELAARGIAATATEADLAGLLYAPEMADPELVIRTSGERRISNFLLWQAAYAEFVFTPTLWPDFAPADLDAALAEYASRQRRFGRRVSA